jgi:hypothetical protein
MGPILTPEDVVRRIAAECNFVDERGAVSIRLKPAAAIVRQYGNQFRAPAAEATGSPAETPAAPLIAIHFLCLPGRVQQSCRNRSSGSLVCG